MGAHKGADCPSGLSRWLNFQIKGYTLKWSPSPKVQMIHWLNLLMGLFSPSTVEPFPKVGDGQP